ncbi:type II toxin-antitoxin system RelE/ParE family toxin [Sandarakinorhabdus oryzae]|uniref:type II toxin-antitoxin system RelE/ParE family toxin n=1 Tax=Sandarakinorhabdus oryzae TaxID=2675220 RepID=UPI0012E27DC2|nr:type II toxin-antitoxin system RelE/ParE family toxin [Sandarakinorhabdus oryzae]
MFPLVFYRTPAGNDVVLDLIRSFDPADRRTIGEDLKTLQMRHPLGLPLSRPLGKGLSELRSSLPSGREFRLFYCFDRRTSHLIVLHGFIKKSQQTPDKEMRIARDRQQEFT